MNDNAARTWIERRLSEYDLGIDNGHDMTPDTATTMWMTKRSYERLDDIEVKLSSIEETLEVVVEKVNQLLDRKPCCWWIGAVARATVENKAALVTAVGILASIFVAAGRLLLSIITGG